MEIGYNIPTLTMLKTSVILDNKVIITQTIVHDTSVIYTELNKIHISRKNNIVSYPALIKDRLEITNDFPEEVYIKR